MNIESPVSMHIESLKRESSEIESLQKFIQNSPTSWHAAEEIARHLTEYHFVSLDEGKRWNLEPAKSYFVKRDGALIAFQLPKKRPTGSTILAAHTDSPALKLKPRSEIKKENMILFGVELYGSPVLATWLNRDLILAGRVVYLKNGQLIHQLVELSDSPLFIPTPPIHLEREINDKGFVLNKQEHLMAIATCQGDQLEGSLLTRMLKKRLSYDELVHAELFLIPAESPRLLGERGEFLASYRLDNLAGCFSLLQALIRTQPESQDKLRLALFWDHEEIGSRSLSGAESPFFQDLFNRLLHFYQMDVEESAMLKNHSLCISVDMGHAYSPAFAQRYDPQHLLLPGKGIAIKYHAELRFASDSKSSGPLIELLQREKIPFQLFANRSDLPSGSTVGPIFSRMSGIPTVDVGIPQFSMHASREVMATADFQSMCALLTLAFNRL